MNCRFALPLLVVALPGCGEALMRAELTDLKKRLDVSLERAASAEKKSEELEDRVFLLVDQVESHKVATARGAVAPRLPVVTLRPTAEAAEPTEPEAVGDIEYQGEARSGTPDKARGSTPFFHLEGPKSSPAKTAVARKSMQSMVIPASAENLGVAPAPRLHAPASPPSPVPAIQKETEDPVKLYRAAYDALKAGDHDAAAIRFRDFVRRFPRHDYADNAQYWLGECFYDRKLYAQAAQAFRAAVEQYPLGNKAPDAMLKLGFCLLSMGEQQKGRDLLAQLPQSYPRTDAARIASERLAQEGPK